MGFWSNLLKGVGVVGSAVAAPFTGGTSLSWLPAVLGGAGAVGEVLGGAASGAAKGQTDQSQLALQQQQLALQGARDALQAPLLRGQAAARGSAMANMQDVNLTSGYQNPWAMKFTGGMRPSVLTPEARALGALMAQQALSGQKTDKGYGGIAQQYPLPQAGFWQKAAGVGGVLGSLGGAIGGALQPSGAKYGVTTYDPEADYATGLDTSTPDAVPGVTKFLTNRRIPTGPWF